MVSESYLAPLPDRGGRIIVEQVAECSWNRWPNGRGFRTLCGNLDEMVVTRALSYARHRDLEIWEEENIPYTLRKKRRAFFFN